MHSDTAARVRFRCSVRSARSSSVSVDRFLPLLRLSDPVFGIAVRFRWFGGGAHGKAVTLLQLSTAIPKCRWDS